MADHEAVTVRMQPDYSTVYEALRPPDDGTPAEVDGIHQLTPYGMVLAGIGTCTGMLLQSYAAVKRFPLAEVRITLRYGRDARRDCLDCPEIETGKERIEVALEFSGELAEEQRQRLREIAHRCPVARLVNDGTPVVFAPPPGAGAATGGTDAT
jgi:uncharacterized OsmC-like protein